MIKNHSSVFPGMKMDFIYDLLRYLECNFVIDIGAAAGDVTKKLCERCGPTTEIHAFEPFPGNQAFLDKVSALCPNVKVHRKAVSNKIGRASFHVPSVVSGDEAGWELRKGYSSVGHLSNCGGFWRSTARSLRDSILSRTPGRKKGSMTLEVEVTTIDNEFPVSRIDFMKADVQGAENFVLQGAHSALLAERIKLLYLEWGGDDKVVRTLSDHGYEVFDSHYVGVPKHKSDLQHFKECGFSVCGSLGLSTGVEAYEFINNGKEEDLISRVKRCQRYGWIQTDLIAFPESFQQDIFNAFFKSCQNSV